MTLNPMTGGGLLGKDFSKAVPKISKLEIGAIANKKA